MVVPHLAQSVRLVLHRLLAEPHPLQGHQLHHLGGKQRAGANFLVCGALLRTHAVGLGVRALAQKRALLLSVMRELLAVDAHPLCCRRRRKLEEVIKRGVNALGLEHPRRLVVAALILQQRLDLRLVCLDFREVRAMPAEKILDFRRSPTFRAFKPEMGVARARVCVCVVCERERVCV